MRTSFFILIALCTSYGPTSAFSQTSESSEASQLLSVGFPFSKIPYINASPPFEASDYDLENDNLGLEVEIFREAMIKTGYRFRIVYATYDRISKALNTGVMDAAVVAENEARSQDNVGDVFYSKPFIAYVNYAISRKADQLKINTIDDLLAYSVVAWRGASHHLESEFTRMSEQHTRYREIMEQRTQYLVFRDRRAQVILINQYIFEFWDKKLNPNRTEYVLHPLFPRNSLHCVGFASKDARDAFDQAMLEITEDGTKKRIIEKYTAWKQPVDTP